MQTIDRKVKKRDLMTHLFGMRMLQPKRILGWYEEVKDLIFFVMLPITFTQM